MFNRITRQGATTKNFIAYYRVSTAKQGQSGLGLEAQKATAQTFAASRGQIVEKYIEIESGKKSDRPKLAAAIAQSKATGATLLIAKLDRLSREGRFIFELRDNGVDFVACDLPEANTLTIGVFASFAQFEREQIAARTKAARRRDRNIEAMAGALPEVKKRAEEAILMYPNVYPGR